MPAVISNECELNHANVLVEYVTCKVRLYVNDVTPSASTGIADLTEATFSGYAPVDITWTGPTTVSNIARLISQSCRFEADVSIGSPETAYGYYVTYTDGGATVRMIQVERFATAKTFEVNHDVRDVTVQLDYSDDV